MSTSILPIRSPSMPRIEPLPSITPNGAQSLADLADGGSIGAGAAASFTDLITSSVAAVESSTQNANSAIQQFLSGANEDFHTVAIAEQKAEIASDLFLQLRNKAVSAYQEVMKMQL